MKTYYVKKNEVYTVIATVECKVYNANGDLITTCQANKSIDIPATTNKLSLSDDNASLRKAVNSSGGSTSAACVEHIENEDIHTTALEKSNCLNHIGNSDVHVTSDEKTKIANSAQLTAVNTFEKNVAFNDFVQFNAGTRFARAATFLSTATFEHAYPVRMLHGVDVLPLGTKTALGADAYGLSVSASGGLQLFGTHFLLGDIFSDNSLKIVSNNLSMYSTDEAAISFDYANRSIFRSMPNNGTEGTYEFQCWQWTDNSHTTKKEAGVKLLKASQVSELEDNSVLNKAECDQLYGKIKHIDYSTEDGEGIEIYDNSQTKTDSSGVSDYKEYKATKDVCLIYTVSNSPNSGYTSDFDNISYNYPVKIWMNVKVNGSYRLCDATQRRITTGGQDLIEVHLKSGDEVQFCAASVSKYSGYLRVRLLEFNYR